MLRKVIITAMLMCLLGATVTAAPAQERQVYQNHELGLQFSTPEAWKKIEVPSPIIVMFAEPPQKDGQSTASVNLVSGDLPEPVALEKFVEENVKNFQNQPAYAVRGKEFKTINGSKVAVLKSSFHHTNGRHIYTDQMITIRDNKLYILTCGTDQEGYKRHSKEFSQIINSFAFDKTGDSFAPPKKEVSRVPQSLAIGDTISEDEFTSISGNKVLIRYLDKPTVLLFWADLTTPENLMRTLPVMQAVAEIRSNKANFYTVNVSGEQQSVIKILERYNSTVPAMQMQASSDFLKYSYGFPVFVIIDQNGVLRYRPDGFPSQKELETLLDSLL